MPATAGRGAPGGVRLHLELGARRRDEQLRGWPATTSLTLTTQAHPKHNVSPNCTKCRAGCDGEHPRRTVQSTCGTLTVTYSGGDTAVALNGGTFGTCIGPATGLPHRQRRAELERRYDELQLLPQLSLSRRRPSPTTSTPTAPATRRTPMRHSLPAGAGRLRDLPRRRRELDLPGCARRSSEQRWTRRRPGMRMPSGACTPTGSVPVERRAGRQCPLHRERRLQPGDLGLRQRRLSRRWRQVLTSAGSPLVGLRECGAGWSMTATAAARSGRAPATIGRTPPRRPRERRRNGTRCT